MFTGLIEEVGTVGKRQEISGGIRLTIESSLVLEDLKIGDSINVDGVCQTVVARTKSSFSVEAVGETLQKTTLGTFKPGRKVNLERALSVSSRMGGHFVQGHVNAVGQIEKWYPRGENYFLEIQVPNHLLRYIVLEGSLAVDGISLTVAQLAGNLVGINIIPYTVRATALQFKNVGDAVNIEVDMLAKYIEKILSPYLKGTIDIDKLKQWGY